MKVEILEIAHGLTKQIKDLISILEANGYSTTEGALNCDDLTIDDFNGIRTSLNQWSVEVNSLTTKDRIRHSHFIMNLVRGSTGYLYKFKKEKNSKLGTLTLSNARLNNNYVIKIHPY